MCYTYDMNIAKTVRDRSTEAYIYTDKTRRTKFGRYARSRGRTMKSELNLYIDSLPDL